MFGLAVGAAVRADDITVTGLQIDCLNDYIERLITVLSNTEIVLLCAHAAASKQ